MIVLNTPHNPSGALISRAELDQLADLIRDRDIYLVSDEVYEHLVFDGVPHVSVLAHEELYQRAFVVSSFGKTYHVTGWKTGYVVAPPALTAELRKVHQYVSFCGVTPLQYALADFMAEHPEHVEELPGFLSGQARSVLRSAGAVALQLHPRGRHLFPVGRLLADPPGPE